MLKIGLTGSIGMGKSTIANMFAQLNIPIWSADSAVHESYKKGAQANIALGAIFGDIYDENGDINRQKLAFIVLNNSEKLKELENIVHPLVKASRAKFINQNHAQAYIIIDVPLLFETNAQSEFDKIIVVNCRPETQKQRVMARPNMTEEKFIKILSQQLPNSEKVKMADFVIDTDMNLEDTKNEVLKIHNILLAGQ